MASHGQIRRRRSRRSRSSRAPTSVNDASGLWALAVTLAIPTLLLLLQMAPALLAKWYLNVDSRYGAQGFHGTLVRRFHGPEVGALLELNSSSGPQPSAVTMTDGRFHSKVGEPSWIERVEIDGGHYAFEPKSLIMNIASGFTGVTYSQPAGIAKIAPFHWARATFLGSLFVLTAWVNVALIRRLRRASPSVKRSREEPRDNRPEIITWAMITCALLASSAALYYYTLGVGQGDWHLATDGRKGVLSDRQGQPVANAGIRMTGANQGATARTNIDGHFRLPSHGHQGVEVLPINDHLVFSFHPSLPGRLTGIRYSKPPGVVMDAASREWRVLIFSLIAATNALACLILWMLIRQAGRRPPPMVPGAVHISDVYGH